MTARGRERRRATARAAFVVFMLSCIPAFGNFVPARVPSLVSARSYAGSCTDEIWLFRKGDSGGKLSRLKRNGGTVREQMAAFPPDEKTREIMTNVNVLLSRFISLPVRSLLEALQRSSTPSTATSDTRARCLGAAIPG